jgi:hypothetical protein
MYAAYMLRMLLDLLICRFPFHWINALSVFTQVQSKRGREIWGTVITNYVVYVFVSFGIW